VKALLCQAGAQLQPVWPASTAGPPVHVKILTYNLFWWNLFRIRQGNRGSAGHLVAQTSAPRPHDIVVFQECRDLMRVMADAALGAEYFQFQGGYELCMAFRRSAWDLLAKGIEVVAEDARIPGQYFGQRAVQWVRLAHRGTENKLFVMNHHGPLPINTGGLCGCQATAGNILSAIRQNAVTGDAVVLLGDFNATAASQTLALLRGHLTHIFNGGVCGGIDSIFSNTLGSAVLAAKNLGNCGSDHDALSVELQLGPPPPKGPVPTVVPLPAWTAHLTSFKKVPGFADGCHCHCEWAAEKGACGGAGDGSCCWRGCCGKLFPPADLPPLPSAVALGNGTNDTAMEGGASCVCDWAQRHGACVGRGDGSSCRRVCCSPGGAGGCFCAWAQKRGACNGTGDGTPCYDVCCMGAEA